MSRRLYKIVVIGVRARAAGIGSISLRLTARLGYAGREGAYLGDGVTQCADAAVCTVLISDPGSDYVLRLINVIVLIGDATAAGVFGIALVLAVRLYNLFFVNVGMLRR